VSYLTTFSGRHISIEKGVPSLPDMALGLSRVVRFAGQGKRFFSVAAHTLWIDDLMQKRHEPEENRLAWMLHDAHESVVSDIPTVFKTLDQKKVGYELDRRIFDTFFARFGGYDAFCDPDVRDAVKHYDRLALVTEYEVIGPGHKSYLEAPAQEHVVFLTEWLRQADRKWVANGHSAGIQEEYLRRVLALM
jgi:hypothetical protein